MPAVFTGRWARGTILNQAFQKAGNKKVLHLGRDRLNRLLEELYTQWEWPFLYTVLPFSFAQNGAPVSLPADFLKTESETTGVMIVAKDGNVVDLPVVEVDPIQFRRRAIPHNLEGDRPLIYKVDYAARQLTYWPIPTAACIANLAYKFLPPDVPIGTGQGGDQTTQAYDADIPLFPWGGFLAMAMEVWALEYDENPRAQDARRECWGPLDPQGRPAAFEAIRNIAMPRQSQEQTLPLDPQVFGPGFRDESSRYFRDWDWWGPSN